ncbi:hypothetical protein PTM93_03140 [Clostridium perfringens]|uniref:hypothetical protein n=1 Tax=Clostridium perfringens TaxID=1502 RepID=UPI0013E2F5FC|nr:hypothetical protein [Clostridium perfringens]EHK2427149.1 hypothetical protein [Clostridium perfringens]EIF6152683.1 hypothetical protein [Clostridium perfringens]ELC8352443.1 hypothetical protein [Clostridium perfringens]ELC8368812.1 hypothetical protein [Clostridium perfringens]ELC8371851.1 hypothetical protein [Clostridium perfringens]
MNNMEISLYDIFLKYSYKQLKEMSKNAKSKDEKNFYLALSKLAIKNTIIRDTK